MLWVLDELLYIEYTQILMFNAELLMNTNYLYFKREQITQLSVNKHLYPLCLVENAEIKLSYHYSVCKAVCRKYFVWIQVLVSSEEGCVKYLQHVFLHIMHVCTLHLGLVKRSLQNCKKSKM